MYYILLALTGIITGWLINLYSGYECTGCREYGFLTVTGYLYKSILYISVEITMAAVFILLYIKYGFNGGYISCCLIYLLLLAAAVVDIKKRIIPDKLVAAGIIGGIVSVFINKDMTLVNAISGFLAAVIVLLPVSLITKGSLGMGDVKLFSCTGLFLGLWSTLTALAASTILSGLAGLVLIMMSFSNRKKSIPFAPFVFAGVTLTLLYL